MSRISLSGNASGTGTLTLSAPNTDTDRTLTLPDNTGTILTNATTAGFPAGSVLQVVSATYSTAVTTTSDSFVTTGLSASITPSNASNKILIICHTGAASANSSASNIFTLFRGTVAGTNLGAAGEGMGSVYSGAGSARGVISFNYLDSPSTTSSQTYTLGFRAGSVGNTQTAQFGNSEASITLMEIAG